MAFDFKKEGSITISVGWVAYTSAHVKASADASLQAALT